MTERRPVRSEIDGIDGVDSIDDMRAFIGHTVWKSAPTAHIDVDGMADLLTVSCYEGFPDVEIDPSVELSVGFHEYRGEYLLTSLCLYGVTRWSQPPPISTAPANDAVVARSLMGGSISGVVADLLGGGSGTVELSTTEAAELTQAWHRFVSDSTSG